MRSNREERQQRKLKYTSARTRAEKHTQGGFSATYLRMPEKMKSFRPKAGTYFLDIMPYKVGEGNPSAEPGMVHYERTYFLHPRVAADGSPYLCPRLTSKSPCPICERRQVLSRSDDPTNEELVKDMAPKERQLFAVINLKEPDKGIQLWDVSYHLFGKLLDARIRNSDEEDGWDTFFALEGGLTLKVTFKEESFGGRTFVAAETIDFRARKEDYDEDTLAMVPCLDELLIETSYKELKAVVLDTAEDEEEPEDDEEPVPKKKAKPAPEPEDDEDEEDEDEDPEEEEDEDEAPPKKKSKAPVEDEEDAEDADEDEEPAPKKSKKSAPAEDEDDFDDFDDEDEAPKKKGKSKAEDEDEEEPEDDEEDEPAPKKKGKPAPEPEEDDEDDENEDPPRVRTRDEELEEDEDEEPAPKKKFRR